ncbi:TIR domain-containing protein [Streptomyces sp. NPDC059517]|uniref:TIR domain-containing protein n=1 Tax=Streptomyces sp. NPDC059517 TaxID=3346855 RepID=UPI0036AE4B0C
MSSGTYGLQAALAQERLTAISRQLEYKADSTTRHKCFLSYHAVDAPEVLSFVNTYGEFFIPRAIGVSEDDPVIQSDNNDYIMDRIREKYLADTTVTIVMVGKCTWARKFVDWEVYSTLRKDKVNRLSGLLALQLPSGRTSNAPLPGRVDDNVVRYSGEDAGYARYYTYPTTGSTLQNWIHDAYTARRDRSHLISNGRARKINNSSCT